MKFARTILLISVVSNTLAAQSTSGLESLREGATICASSPVMHYAYYNTVDLAHAKLQLILILIFGSYGHLYFPLKIAYVHVIDYALLSYDLIHFKLIGFGRLTVTRAIVLKIGLFP